MNIESVVLYYFVFGLLLIPLVIGIGMVRKNYRSKREAQRQVSADQSTLEYDLESEEVLTMAIEWNDIVTHHKVDEYVKVNGTINGVAKYYLIAMVGTFKSFGLVQLSVGDKILTPREGSKTLANLKGGDYAIIRYSGDHGITIDLKTSEDGIQAVFMHDPHAFLAIENKMSLVKGNSILFHYKEKKPALHYIKQWEIPTSYASFAAFSDSSNISSVAEKVVSAGVFQETIENQRVPMVAELLDGTFYVLGADCTDVLNFMCTEHLAIRLITEGEVDSQQTEMPENLTHVMAAIQEQPMVHLKMRLDKFKSPFVVFKRENDDAESAVNLNESNMLISLPDAQKKPLEIVKIETRERKDGFPVIQLTLNNMRKSCCPYVAIWKY